jgi:hypothetical protein
MKAYGGVQLQAFSPWHKMEVGGRLQTLATLFLVNFLLNWTLGLPRVGLNIFGEGENLAPLLGIKTKYVVNV